MHAIATGLGAARVVSLSDCGAMALYTRRAAEGKLIGLSFSRTKPPSVDDKGDSWIHSVGTGISIALSDNTGQLVCVNSAEPEIFLTGESGYEDRPADSASTWNDKVSRIIRWVLEPYIDQSLLQDVLGLSELIESAGALYIVIDPTRLKNGEALILPICTEKSYLFNTTAVERKR